MSSNDTANYKTKFKYEDQCGEYTFQLKHRKFRWWWLLFGLLLLLLIRCEREITVETYDMISGEAMPGVQASIDYNEHFIYKNGRFFGRDHIHRAQTTDDDGRAVFKKLPCSVFSYIFTCMAKASFRAESDCYYMDPSVQKSLFHFTKRKKLELQPFVTDIRWTVIDAVSKDPIAGALVEYEYNLSSKLVADSTRTDAAGQCVIKGAPKCGQIKLARVSAHAYEDATDIHADVPDILDNPSLAVTELEPERASFTVFVKNKVSRQPLSNAVVTVKITSPSGSFNATGQAVTNGDGKTRGEYGYEEGVLLYHLSLHAERVNFKPGDFEYVDAAGKRKDPYTVSDFLSLKDDSLRVIYLEPLPFVQEFQNIDSISGKPIPCAVNVVTVTSADGKTTTTTVQANNQGYFDVRACEGDKIHIESSHPKYEDKTTDISSFSNESGQKIRMYPIFVSLEFKTIDATTKKLLGNCTLQITTKLKGSVPPTNSGSGTFTVDELDPDDYITIHASHDGYGSNTTKVSNALVETLRNAPADARTIPLTREFEYNDSPTLQSLTYLRDYEIGDTPPYRFKIEWYECCTGDCSIINIRDANGNVIFNNGPSVGTGTKAGIQILESPTPTIKIYIQDKNTHPLHFKITSL